MIRNFKLKNLVVQGDDHTDLFSTDKEVVEIRKALLPKFVSINRNSQKYGDEKHVVVIRINKGESLVVYANKKCNDNPTVFYYNSASRSLEESVQFDSIKSLANEYVLLHATKMLDNFESLDM